MCGGHSGTPCRGGVGWAQDNTNTHHHQETDMAGQDPVQECTDLINNRGCVKQFVNGGKILSWWSCALCFPPHYRDINSILQIDFSLLPPPLCVFIIKLSFLSTFHPHKCTINVELQKISRQRLQFEISTFKKKYCTILPDLGMPWKIFPLFTFANCVKRKSSGCFLF